eukprot:514535-Prymnesium_polylepis.1
MSRPFARPGLWACSVADRRSFFGSAAQSSGPCCERVLRGGKHRVRTGVARRRNALAMLE